MPFWAFFTSGVWVLTTMPSEQGMVQVAMILARRWPNISSSTDAKHMRQAPTLVRRGW